MSLAPGRDALYTRKRVVALELTSCPQAPDWGRPRFRQIFLRNMPCRLGERNFPKYPLSGGWSSTRPPKTEPPSPSFYDLEVGNVQFSSPAAR